MKEYIIDARCHVYTVKSKTLDRNIYGLFAKFNLRLKIIYLSMCFYFKFSKIVKFYYYFFFLRIIFLVSFKQVIINVDEFRRNLIDDVEHYVC